MLSADAVLADALEDTRFPLLITLMTVMDDGVIAACREATSGEPFRAAILASGWRGSADGQTTAVAPIFTAPEADDPQIRAASVVLALLALEGWLESLTAGTRDLASQLHRCSPFRELAALVEQHGASLE